MYLQLRDRDPTDFSNRNFRQVAFAEQLEGMLQAPTSSSVMWSHAPICAVSVFRWHPIDTGHGTHSNVMDARAFVGIKI